MDDRSPTELDDLPEELIHLVKPELQPGERLLWASRAGVGSSLMSPWPSLAAGTWFFGFAVVSVGCLSMVTNKNPGADGFFGVVGLISGVIVFFFLIGFVNHFFSKREERRKLTGQVYALTDQRAVLWGPIDEVGRLGPYIPARDHSGTDLHRVQYPDGSGDVLFRVSYQQPSGFLGIADVRRVEELVRRFLVVPGQGPDPVVDSSELF